MKTRYAIRHKLTKAFFSKRLNGVSTYADSATVTFESRTEAAIKVIELGASNILEVVPV